MTLIGPMQVALFYSLHVAAVCFGYNARSKKYLAPNLIEQTRLRRDGLDLNPFWPLPYKVKGVIGADLIILEYRGEPLTLTKIFALIEINLKVTKLMKSNLSNIQGSRSNVRKKKN